MTTTVSQTIVLGGGRAWRRRLCKTCCLLRQILL